MITKKENDIISKFFDISIEHDKRFKIDIHWDDVYSIPEFAVLKHTHQSPKWHSESEFVSGHVENVANECKAWIESSFNLDYDFAVTLMLSALFHDVGKSTTTFFKESDGMWHHYGHEIESERITRRILWDLGCDLRENVCGLVRWHMEPLNIMKSKDPASKILDLQNKVHDLKSLYYLKVFDIKGSKSADPDISKFDIHMLDFFVDICSELNCFNGHNHIDTIKNTVNSLMNKKPKLKIDIYLGLPGSGKDTEITKRLGEYRNTSDVAIICRDDIRIELGYCGKDEKYLGNNEEENKVTEIFNSRLMDAARSGKHIVINNMNNRRKYRDIYKNMLKGYNVYWRYIYVEASELSKNIERRRGQIDETAFARMVEGFEFPNPDEYNELIIVNT